MPPALLLVDAVIATARADAPREWARYCEIAPRILSVADAPREMLRQARLTRGRYDGTHRWVSGDREVVEARALEDIFLAAFVAACTAGRRVVRGVPQGQHIAVDIDPVLIKAEAFKGIKGDDKWELAGVTFFGVHVVEGSSLVAPSPSLPELEDASESEIHAEISAEHKDCTENGRKPPNLKEIGRPVQDRLRAKGRYATLERIQDLASDKRYVGIRHRPGPRQQRRKPAGTAPEQR
jgi:hypothetical protein